MPPHLKKRTDRKGSWYIVDGRTMFSTKTDNEQYAKEMLERYTRDRRGLSEPVPMDQNAKELFKQFGKPDEVTNMRRLRFPCVYVFIRAGEVVYVGSSVNGFARVMASHHPMVTNANDSDQIAFWVIGSEAEARETEIKMIKALKPRFNLGENGELKRTGYGQRTQPYNELKKLLRQVIREELKADCLRAYRQERDPQDGRFRKVAAVKVTRATTED
jgi:hypothetical protein